MANNLDSSEENQATGQTNTVNEDENEEKVKSLLKFHHFFLKSKCFYC